MNDLLYKELCEAFDVKPSQELRSIIAEQDTGDWTEEAIGAATFVLKGRSDDIAVEEPAKISEPIDQGVFTLSGDEIAACRTRIKILGWIYCIAAVLPVAVFFCPIIFDGVGSVSVLFAFIGLMIGGVFMVIGSGLIKLDKRSRGPGLMLSTLFIFIFPIGTVVGVFGFYLLGKRGGVMLEGLNHSSDD